MKHRTWVLAELFPMRLQEQAREFGCPSVSMVVLWTQVPASLSQPPLAQFKEK